MESIKNNLELRFANIVPDVWERLSQIPRTGWVNRGVENPETVQAHTISLRNLAKSFLDESAEFSEEEKTDLIDMLEVHDFPEAIVGDEVIFTKDKKEKEKLKAEKEEREKTAMIEITKNLGEEGKRMLDLWIRFESMSDRVSIFAKQLDRYQAMEQAKIYELAGQPVRAQEFIDYSKDEITHPFLVAKLDSLQSKIN